MMRKFSKAKAAALFAIFMLAGLLLQGKGAYAADLSLEDVQKFSFAFEMERYGVNLNEEVTLKINTDIPDEALSIEYFLDNACVQIVPVDGNPKEVRLRGAYPGESGITAVARVGYLNEEGMQEEYEVTARAAVTVYPDAERISEEYARRALGSGPYALSIVNYREGTLAWESSDKTVADVDANGVVTPVSEGQAYITATLTRPSGDVAAYRCVFYVTNPVMSFTKTNLARNTETSISISGTVGYAEWASSNPNIASAYQNTYENEAPGAIISAYKVGTATISASIDGITISCVITVTDPHVKKDFYMVEKGARKEVNLKGINSASKVSYSSSDSGVATVSKSGAIKAKGLGYAAIIAKADGAEVTVSVNVGKKKAVKAVKNALKAVGSTYSQARRMQKGYYDCSSLVWRSYAPLGIYFGDRRYAPVAASEARYMVSHRKTVPVKYINKLNKLRPGDVIFFQGKYNGRYKNIYHVAIYMGQQGQSYGGDLYTYGRIVHASGVKVTEGYIYNADNVAVIGRPAG